jgi:hypothetical protein
MPLVPHVPAAEARQHADLVVALDAGDLVAADLGRAMALVASCPGCAALRDDLAAIRTALGALPAPARRRDYRLTDEDAARLRPTAWRRFVGWLRAPGTSVRPLATGLATLGIAGLLLTAGLPGLGGGPAALLSAEDGAAGGVPYTDQSTHTDQWTRASGDVESTASEEPAAAPAEVPVPGLAGEQSPDEQLTDPRDRNSAGAAENEPGVKETATDPAGSPEPPVLPVLSLIALAGGLGLLVASFAARRRAT